MVSVKAAATGRVSWGPMVSGLGPLEHPEENTQKGSFKIKSTHKPHIFLWVVPYLHRRLAMGSHTDNRGVSTNKHTVKSRTKPSILNLDSM